jgi:putative transcriptional regulator
MLNTDLKVSFTQKELSKMGVEMQHVDFSPEDIGTIRKKIGLSQAVFAKMLNVSLSSVRQWEQGVRKPTGATMVLLELLKKEPHLLDYRLGRDVM